ncbi:MAG: YggU family protein [Bdellovibrionales bacterium]|nr:YggU family protein [Bdellovibrionales bacterium]
MEWAREHRIKNTTGTLLLLYIQPGASKTAVKGLFGGPARLKIAIQAPPVDGAANKAVIDFLAKAFRIGRAKIHILSGETSRQKNIWIEGMSLSEVAGLVVPE